MRRRWCESRARRKARSSGLHRLRRLRQFARELVVLDDAGSWLGAARVARRVRRVPHVDFRRDEAEVLAQRGPLERYGLVRRAVSHPPQLACPKADRVRELRTIVAAAAVADGSSVPADEPRLRRLGLQLFQFRPQMLQIATAADELGRHREVEAATRIGHIRGHEDTTAESARPHRGPKAPAVPVRRLLARASGILAHEAFSVEPWPPLRRPRDDALMHSEVADLRLLVPGQRAGASLHERPVAPEVAGQALLVAQYERHHVAVERLKRLKQRELDIIHMCQDNFLCIECCAELFNHKLTPRRLPNASDHVIVEGRESRPCIASSNEKQTERWVQRSHVAPV
mmetsp:Transcript_35499/g.60864  ORF Transcript_35499/g.60864 Transcript_35499/m.60864 type:complete len:343 (-) Transcript_35499:41-1069(-)